MWEAPIVEEVPRTRDKLAAEYNFDVKTMFAALRKREASLGGRRLGHAAVKSCVAATISQQAAADY